MLWIATTREVGIRPRPLPLVVSQCVGFVLRGMAPPCKDRQGQEGARGRTCTGALRKADPGGALDLDVCKRQSPSGISLG